MNEPPLDWESIADLFFGFAFIGGHHQVLADQLGVSAKSLKSICCGYDPWRQIWTFPECDADMKTIGIGTRSTTGKKGFIRGGHRGLILPPALDPDNPVYIVEGPSDTAAVIASGRQGVGRPSVSGGKDLLCELLVGFGDISVISENDGGVGQQGAVKLAKSLSKSLKQSVTVVIPPHKYKDVRTWLRGSQCKKTI